MRADDLFDVLIALPTRAHKAQPLGLIATRGFFICATFLAVFDSLHADFVDDFVATFGARFVLCHAASVGVSVYSDSGGQLHTRLRSPYTLSIRPTGGQYRSLFRESTGNAAC